MNDPQFSKLLTVNPVDDIVVIIWKRGSIVTDEMELACPLMAIVTANAMYMHRIMRR